MNSSSRSVDGQLVVVAVFRDRDPADQFHHEVGPSLLGRSGVQHVGDVGMIHQGESLAFGLKPGDHGFAVHAWLDDFQGDLATHGFDLLGRPDDPHPAFAQLLTQLVGTDPGAGLLGQWASSERFRQVRDRILQEAVRVLVGRQEPLDFHTEVGVLRTRLVQVLRPLRGGLLDRFGENLFFVHGWFRRLKGVVVSRFHASVRNPRRDLPQGFSPKM